MTYMSNRSICLTVSHNVFLSREQRYALVADKAVRTLGVSVPVWLKKSGKTDEPAEEVFCWYELHPADAFGITWTDEGYVIYLSKEVRDGLRDVPDFGSECAMCTHHGELAIKNKTYNMLHFISIQDNQSLLKSLS